MVRTSGYLTDPNSATHAVKSLSRTITDRFILDSVFPMALAILFWTQTLSIANHYQPISRLQRTVMDEHLPHRPKDPENHTAFYAFYPLNWICF